MTRSYSVVKVKEQVWEDMVAQVVSMDRILMDHPVQWAWVRYLVRALLDQLATTITALVRCDSYRSGSR